MQSHTSTYVCTLKIPNTGSHTSYYCLDTWKYWPHQQEWVAPLFWLLCLTQVRQPKFPARDNEVLISLILPLWAVTYFIYHSPCVRTKQQMLATTQNTMVTFGNRHLQNKTNKNQKIRKQKFHIISQTLKTNTKCTCGWKYLGIQ